MNNVADSVAVIGSGLSAIGAIRALIEHGVKPTVIDWGDQRDIVTDQLVKTLAAQDPEDWSKAQRDKLTVNPTLSDGSRIPKKLNFGSDYFYGKDREDAPVRAKKLFPPFSYALGGLSVGWGAAVLPPQGCDVSDWPVSVEELQSYCGKVLKDLDYSAVDDRLSDVFPLLKKDPVALKPGTSESQFLSALEEAGIADKTNCVFGQSRLLVTAGGNGEPHGCRYCGECMAGCVYGAIYKSGDELLRLSNESRVDYRPGVLVQTIVEHDGKVNVRGVDHEGKTWEQTFARVFLAAGAVNSTRIALASSEEPVERLMLKSRGGFVVPVLSLRRRSNNWPISNTLPGLFMELKPARQQHWVHVQLSFTNELFLRKLGAVDRSDGLLGRMRRFIAEHVFIAFINFHSDHAGYYELSLDKPEASNATPVLVSTHIKARERLRTIVAIWRKLFDVFLRVRCIPLLGLARSNDGTYHVGGTLPMRANSRGPMETDTLGRLSQWQHVNVVDTSVFPSLPGTTIGLLAMANAYRIVDGVFNQAKKANKGPTFK